MNAWRQNYTPEPQQPTPRRSRIGRRILVAAGVLTFLWLLAIATPGHPIGGTGVVCPSSTQAAR